MALVTTISGDMNTVLLEMQEDGKPLAHMRLDASAVDDAIQNLSLIRARMADQVAPALEPNALVDGTHFPAWMVTKTHSGPDQTLMLVLRHPGLGWRGFFLEPATALELAQALQSPSALPAE